MSREYKNILRLKNKAYGKERRSNLSKEELKDSTPIPNPLEYKDIDEEFKRWVEEDLDISFENERLTTISLFSNQRFSEYMQTWDNVDDKKNLLMNFKVISRENNPKYGTINGNSKNIPGERTYLMKRVAAVDKNNREYYIDYRVKQPISIDFIYTVTIVTNKYELINEFNLMINDKFKAINCYIRPKGHFIPMKLNDISDESEYSLDNRRFYSQSYNILVMAYIMPEDSFIVEEKPKMKLLPMDFGYEKGSYADVIEYPCDYKETTDYEYIPVSIEIHLDRCESCYRFKIDFDFKVNEVKLDNVRSFKAYVNDKEIDTEFKEQIKNGYEIRISKLCRFNTLNDSSITLIGVDKSNTYKYK